jgi:protein transport protein SEC9
MGLFSKKKKEPVEESPYAANPITPYEQARNGLPSNPRMNSFGSSPAPPPYQSPSVASNSSRFGDEKYGNQNGYGSNRYDNQNASAFNANQSRTGGYGGFGDDAGSNELFGGASSRYVPPQQGTNASPANSSASFQSPSDRYDDPSKSALLGSAKDRYNPLPPPARNEAPAEDDEYGGYGAPRELTGEQPAPLNYRSRALIQRRGGKGRTRCPEYQG